MIHQYICEGCGRVFTNMIACDLCESTHKEGHRFTDGMRDMLAANQCSIHDLVFNKVVA